MADAREWVELLAAWDLPGTPPIEPLLAPLGTVMPAVRREKLVGVLAAAVACDELAVSDEDRALIAAAHRTAMSQVLLLDDVMLASVDVLDGAGVGHRVLKGSALAHLVHPDAAQRCYGDTDLLVEGSQLPAAVDALAAAGATREQPALSTEFDRRFAKSITLRWRNRTELDLHRTLVPGPYGLLIDTADLRRDRRSLILAGRSLDTPPLEIHLLHGALHAVLGDIAPRLGSLRDIALMAARTDLDVDRVLGTARRWRCEAPVARGIAAADGLGAARNPLTDWATGYRVDAADERLLAVYDRRDGRFRRQALASLRVLPTWADRVAYARAVVTPRIRKATRRGRPTRYARRP